MRKFLVVFRQSGGCDYTIGCGIKIEEIEANSLEEACVLVCGSLIDAESDRAYYLRDEINLSDCEIIEFSRKVVVDIPGIRLIQKEEKEKKSMLETERLEREKYEALKAKFEREEA